MDFGALLQIAKKNRETSNDEAKYYKTKFAPPKKETKESKRLSENIQKFLQKRELEEKKKEEEEKRKLANLLAMRDERSKNKIRKMLKVTKSANKSVLDDAIDNSNTAVTLAGPDQPDQDDYGYVSNEANAYYQRYIEKVKDVKVENAFPPSRPQSVRDLSDTKARVKAAIVRDKDEKLNGTRQRNKSSQSSSSTNTIIASKYTNSSSSSKHTLYDPEKEKREEEERKNEEKRKKAKNRPNAPPPLDFHALLKLAEKKQYEPIEIVVETKKKEPERLLTSKEKRELEEQKLYEEARKRRKLEAENKQKETTNTRPLQMERIPKLNQTIKNNVPSVNKKSISNDNSNSFNKDKTLEKSTSSSKSVTKLNTQRSSNGNSALNKSNSAIVTNTSQNERNKIIENKTNKNVSVREFPPRDIKSMHSKPQQSRQFPPSDMQQRKKPPPKRRIIDDEDDDEYDSEMDDFIDDGDAEEDYSSHIKEIFGYDKSRYRNLDEEDDAAMESNFAQVQREEYISKKIGIQEDLEDMRLEAEEKKRKMQRKR